MAQGVWARVPEGLVWAQVQVQEDQAWALVAWVVSVELVQAPHLNCSLSLSQSPKMNLPLQLELVKDLVLGQALGLELAQVLPSSFSSSSFLFLIRTCSPS